MGKKIGIDLGTTYSRSSYLGEDGKPKIVCNIEGESSTPSAVFFDGCDCVVVGSTAKAEGLLMPEALAERTRNYMGDADYSFYANGVEYSSSAIASLILKKIVMDAESELNDAVESVVITCPIYYTEEARAATKIAGEHVNNCEGNFITVYKILEEPVAAAIAYMDLIEDNDVEKNVLFYDLGGSSFDCTVMKISNKNGARQPQIIASGGNRQLGGIDWDYRLETLIREKFCSATGCDIDEMTSDFESVAWFKENIERAKKCLTNRESTSLTPSYNGNRERIGITRAEFEQATESLLDQTINLVNDTLEKHGLDMNKDIDEIVLLGGSSYMPQVKNRLEKEYKKYVFAYEQNNLVAMGAAIIADDGDCVRRKIKTKRVIKTKTKRSYGIELKANGTTVFETLLHQGTVLPATGNITRNIPLSIVDYKKAQLSFSLSILSCNAQSLNRRFELIKLDEIEKTESKLITSNYQCDNKTLIEMSIKESGLLVITVKNALSETTYSVQLNKNELIEFDEIEEDCVFGDLFSNISLK